MTTHQKYKKYKHKSAKYKRKYKQQLNLKAQWGVRGASLIRKAQNKDTDAIFKNGDDTLIVILAYIQHKLSYTIVIISVLCVFII